MEFSTYTLHWYYKNQRDLPWRASKEPYKVWISEIILQQTRVAQGIDYYEAFVAAFPTIKDLALADEEQVLKLWQGLGYYSRARNIHFTAKYIYFNLQNKFPTNYKDLLKLKGVGPYTAAAISSICYNEKQAAVDGNVYRVLSRVFNINTPINSSAGIKEFQCLADSLINTQSPGDYNQALMELGAIICTPKKANCQQCPLQSKCIAFSKNLVGELPVKEKKIIIKNRFLNYYCIEHQNQILINKREKKDIWLNLYDFPVDEFNSAIEFANEAPSEYLLNLVGGQDFVVKKSISYKHKLSHQHLHINIQHIKPVNYIIQNKYILLNKIEILKLPVPKPIEEFLKELF